MVQNLMYWTHFYRHIIITLNYLKYRCIGPTMHYGEYFFIVVSYRAVDMTFLKFRVSYFALGIALEYKQLLPSQNKIDIMKVLIETKKNDI
jgi:hypothetical protein